MLNYADTAWYCVILRAVAAKFTQHHVHVRGCNQCECRRRNQRVRLQRVRSTRMHARARAQCE